MLPYLAYLPRYIPCCLALLVAGQGLSGRPVRGHVGPYQVGRQAMAGGKRARRDGTLRCEQQGVQRWAPSPQVGIVQLTMDLD